MNTMTETSQGGGEITMRSHVDAVILETIEMRSIRVAVILKNADAETTHHPARVKNALLLQPRK
jgi:hypothetical protein